MSENQMKIKKYHIKGLGHMVFWTSVILAGILFIVGVHLICNKNFRLDQYASSIFGTTAGVVGTMFGLTTASYAFIWGELRSDDQGNSHLKMVLERYRKILWNLFVASLIMTVTVIVWSLFCLAIIQSIETEILTEISIAEWNISLKRQEYDSISISIMALGNVLLSIVAVVLMAWMNWDIFDRNEKYRRLAAEILFEIKNRYSPSSGNRKYGGALESAGEYERIHKLEVLVERIIKNHESIGNAFAVSQRREKVLEIVLTNALRTMYNLEGYPEINFPELVDWEYLEENKRKRRSEKCREQAVNEYKRVAGKEEKQDENLEKPPTPLNCSFIRVYSDLLLYRDNSLVWEEMAKKELRNPLKFWERQSEPPDLIVGYDFRCTIKKRLLIFYLRGENFNNMDLTGVSLSGADLRYTNFSDCNLRKIRLKGSNCEGADFSRSKMTGMYFVDSADIDNYEGEIQLSCLDEQCDDFWDPYEGREITNLINATFKEADVSRARLNAPGTLNGNSLFPFEKDKNELQIDSKGYSLQGTNFDGAKLFFSYFKNVDFTNSSLEAAQMYNIGLVQVTAKSANFSNAMLTNACIAWCDFENADFSNAVFAETIILRVNFCGANLRKSNFSYSNISGCNFAEASCQDVSFKNMKQDLEEVRDKHLKALRGVDMGIISRIDFSYATLTNADFSGAALHDLLFVHSAIKSCIFTKTIIENSEFDGSLCSDSVYNSSRFSYVQFKNTVFRNAVIANVKFINCRFQNVDFSNALFSTSGEACFVSGFMMNVSFENAQGLIASSFHNILLRNVDFTGTRIKPRDFLPDVVLLDCLF